jgi:hypothetical protein
MDNLLYLRLEAHNPFRNHHRRYDIRVGRDLFGHWVVTIGYGRDGVAGQQLKYSDASGDGVREIIRYYLDRRASAPRRIGCEYRVCELSVSSGVTVEEWLPASWIAAHLAGKDTLPGQIPPFDGWEGRMLLGLHGR